jgi:hypothetical protein
MPTHLLNDPGAQSWKNMLRRCFSPKSRDYARYGARGITVCDRWRESFEAFISDMGPRPSRLHSIDRIDNDGPYCPENCRWATKVEQASNRRTNQKITFRGETLTVHEWSRRTGLKAPALYWRLHAGWDAEKTLTTPAAPTYTHNGETLTLKQWSDRLGINVPTLQWRLHRWPLERALSAPLR